MTKPIASVGAYDPYCKRSARDIPEVVEFGVETERTPDEVARDDGTWHPQTDEFACDECYIALGSPTAPNGWKAGDPVG